MPVIPERLCECRQVATRSVWVRQLTATGEEITAELRVCADCFDWIMATDPGASAAPLPRLRQRELSWTRRRETAGAGR